MSTGCSFETWIYNLFIREGYFQLYEPKNMATYPYVWDILVYTCTRKIKTMARKGLTHSYIELNKENTLKK